MKKRRKKRKGKGKKGRRRKEEEEGGFQEFLFYLEGEGGAEKDESRKGCVGIGRNIHWLTGLSPVD